MSELVTITVDGQAVQVPKGTNLIEAAKGAGVEIPVFCHHPKLEPAGLCRMCMVQVEGLRKLVTACTTPASDGMVVHTTTPEVTATRKGTLEFLLLNHPLDCPICDKGGECDLQDLTFSYGAAESRLHMEKKHQRKAVDLGPFIVLDEERCILCRRCVRFDDEVAQERVLQVEERGADSVITVAEGEIYDSYFGGNTIELCPVGALTSKSYRFKARPWDLERVGSVCTECSVGCTIRHDLRFGELLRNVSREDPEVDNGWLCDRGRFHFRYNESPRRLTKPLVRKGDQLQEASWNEAFAVIKREFSRILNEKGGQALGVLGGGRLRNEEAYVLQKLARVALKTPNVDYRTGEQLLASLGDWSGRLADIDRSRVILVIDELPGETAPVADLRVRQAVGRKGARLFTLGPVRPDYGVPQTHLARVEADLAETVEELRRLVAEESAPLPSSSSLQALAESLAAGETVTILWSGRQAEVGLGLRHLCRAIARRGGSVGVLIPGETPNARGAEAMGLLPGFLPGYQAVSSEAARGFSRWGKDWAQGDGLDAAGMFQAVLAGELDGLYVVGANPALSWPDGATVRAALQRVPFLVVQDLFLTETGREADVVLPVASSLERGGHVTNLEGRIRPVTPPLPRPEGLETDGAVFRRLAEALGQNNLAATWQEVEWEIEHLAGVEAAKILPGAPLGLIQKMADQEPPRAAAPSGATGEDPQGLVVLPVARLYAGGGTSPQDPDLTEVRPVPTVWLSPADARRLGVAAGDPVRLRGTGGEIDVFVALAEHVAEGSCQVVRNLPEAPANRLTGVQGGRIELRKIQEEAS